VNTLVELHQLLDQSSELTDNSGIGIRSVIGMLTPIGLHHVMRATQHARWDHRWTLITAKTDANVMSKKRSPIWGFSSPPTQKQLTLEESAGHTGVWPTCNARALHISRKIGEMIVWDSQPLCIVSDAGFLELLNALEPRYQVPSRKCITNTRDWKQFES